MLGKRKKTSEEEEDEVLEMFCQQCQHAANHRQLLTNPEKTILCQVAEEANRTNVRVHNAKKNQPDWTAALVWNLSLIHI